MNINNNYYNRLLNNNVEELKKHTTQLSTGKRINSGSDDAASLQVSTRFAAQSRGNSQAIRNVQDGISMLKTTDSSLMTIQDMLQRARELSVQGKNGTYTNEQKTNIENEIKTIMQEVNELAKRTTFNGIPLLTNGKSAELSGATAADQRVKIEGVPVNTTLGAKTTVEFWMYWEGNIHTMPLGWEEPFDLYFQNGHFGVNTGNGGVLGTPFDGLQDKWVHVAATFTNGVPDQNNTEIYLNGEKQTLSFTSGVSSRTVSSTVHIGGWGGNNSYDFAGKVDELKIWDGPRTEAQIKEGMNEVLKGDEENLLGYWRFNETTIKDESINGNDGQLVNGAIIGEGITEPVKIHTDYKSEADDWVGLPSISTDILDISTIDLDDPKLIEKLDKAINVVSENRGNIGSKINRYEFKINNLNENINNTEAAKMRIEDLDFASAMSEVTKSEIKMNIANQMLKMNNSHYEQRMQMLAS